MPLETAMTCNRFGTQVTLFSIYVTLQTLFCKILYFISDSRCVESAKIRSKYPDRIPVSQSF